MILVIQKVNSIIAMTGENRHDRQCIKAVHETEKLAELVTKNHPLYDRQNSYSAILLKTAN